MTRARPNTLHRACGLIDHLSLWILGFCAASLLNDGSLSLYSTSLSQPYFTCLFRQHAICPTETLLREVFIPYYSPRYKSARCRHTVGLQYDGCREHTHSCLHMHWKRKERIIFNVKSLHLQKKHLTS